MGSRQRCGIFINAAYHLKPPRRPFEHAVHPAAHAGLPSPFGPLMARTFITWADGTSIKETLCQQDGKHVSGSVLMCLLERSLKSNRACGSPLCSPGEAVWHHLAGGNWWGTHGVTGSLMAAYYIGFLQQSHVNICACHFQ